MYLRQSLKVIIQDIVIIYALGFGYVLFEETFNLLTYLGMTLVMVGVVLNVAYKKQKPKGRKLRNGIGEVYKGIAGLRIIRPDGLIRGLSGLECPIRSLGLIGQAIIPIRPGRV
jgi:hypothetical protein